MSSATPNSKSALPSAAALETLPPLTLFAAVVSIVEVGFNRWFLRVFDASLPHMTAINLGRWGDFVRNLAAIAILIALLFVLYRFLASGGHLRLRRRVSLAVFAGIFVPAALWTIFSPAEYVTVKLILIQAAAAYVLSVLMGVSAAIRPAPRGIRAAAALVVLCCFSAFLSLVLSQIIGRTAIGFRISVSCLALGECAYLAVPIALAFTLWHRVPDRFGRGSQIAAGMAALLLLVGLAVGQASLGDDWRVLIYGSHHVSMVIDAFPTLYTLLLPAFAFSIVLGLFNRDALGRMAGAGVLLWFTAGYAPTTSLRMLMLVLGAGLIARACLGMGKRAHAARPRLAKPATTPTDAAQKPAVPFAAPAK